MMKTGQWTDGSTDVRLSVGRMGTEWMDRGTGNLVQEGSNVVVHRMAAQRAVRDAAVAFIQHP